MQLASASHWRDDRVARDLGRRVARSDGAALIIDYGHTKSAIGDTLQAVSGHGFADPLVTPGQVDLTGHVDFQALSEAAEAVKRRARRFMRPECPPN